MGTFQGHLLPGLFFVSFSVWWVVQITKRKWICDMKGIPFYSTSIYNGLWGKCLTLPMEGIIKIVATLVGMSLEILASTDYGRAGRIVFWGDVQHVTMYLFFCLSGIVDVCRHYKTLTSPPGLDYIVSALAFGVEFLLFSFHLHDRSPLDIVVHTLLLYAIVGCVLAVLIEYKYRNNLLAAYNRCFFVFTQGTWFIQVGFILYPPVPSMKHWDQGDPDQMMIATMMFTWHLAVNIIIIFLISSISRCIYERHCFIRPGCLEYDMVGQTPINGKRCAFRGRYDNFLVEDVDGVHYDSLAENYHSEDDDILYEQPLDKALNMPTS